MNTFFGQYFDFCLELAVKTWAKASLRQSLWIHDPNHTHSLASFQWSSERSTWLNAAYKSKNGAPTRGEEWFLSLFVLNKVRNGLASADQGFSTASQGSCHVYGTPSWNPPTSPYPAFLLVQNLHNHYSLLCGDVGWSGESLPLSSSDSSLSS